MYYFAFYIQDELFNSKKNTKKNPKWLAASMPSKNLQLAGIVIAIDILSKL